MAMMGDISSEICKLQLKKIWFQIKSWKLDCSKDATEAKTMVMNDGSDVVVLRRSNSKLSFVKQVVKPLSVDDIDDF
ncbi:hypothetical protein VNO77_38933 [Canavalia gladiata]|uniref:Uncharacterized protein n=1 Tax=Canavalia gladiata TaxID=3824 RepID=A0AAN9KCG0_CANGL